MKFADLLENSHNDDNLPEQGPSHVEDVGRAERFLRQAIERLNRDNTAISTLFRNKVVTERTYALKSPGTNYHPTDWWSRGTGVEVNDANKGHIDFLKKAEKQHRAFWDKIHDIDFHAIAKSGQDLDGDVIARLIDAVIDDIQAAREDAKGVLEKYSEVCDPKGYRITESAFFISDSMYNQYVDSGDKDKWFRVYHQDEATYYARKREATSTIVKQVVQINEKLNKLNKILNGANNV